MQAATRSSNKKLQQEEAPTRSSNDVKESTRAQVQYKMAQEFEKKLQEQRDEFWGLGTERETADHLRLKNKVIKAVEEQSTRQTNQYQESLQETQATLQVKLQQLEAEQRQQTQQLQANQNLEREIQQLQKRTQNKTGQTDTSSRNKDDRYWEADSRKDDPDWEESICECENYNFLLL